MKLLVFHLVLVSSLFLASVQSKSIQSAENGEPRIFFRQMIEASGLFPLEINVPDTIGTMMNGLTAAYDTMSMYFGNGNDGGQMEMTRNRKKKKVKRKKKKITEDYDDYNFLQYFML